MLASYLFNTENSKPSSPHLQLPALKLLEGGMFYPDQFSPVLINEEGETRLKFFRWGLVPSWSESPTGRNQRVFAPAEEALRHPAYQIPVVRNRCLIPADAFFISRWTPNYNRRFLVQPDMDKQAFFAGIYDIWVAPDGSYWYSFAILTTKSPASFSHLSSRSPLMLSSKGEATWLNPESSIFEIKRLLNFKFPGIMVAEEMEVEAPAIQETKPNYTQAA